MSVLTQSEVDIAQTQKYKEMLGLTNFLTNTSGTIMVASGTIQSDLFVSGNSNFNGTSTIVGSLYVSGNTLFSNSITINSSLFVSGNCVILGVASFNSNLTISGQSNLLGNLIINGAVNVTNSVTCSGSINIGGASSFNNYIKVKNVKSLSDTLSIQADVINIGNNNTSAIQILGTTFYVATNQLKVLDKNIIINNNAISTGSNGGNCGIAISSTLGTGYIKTTNDGMRYQIISPNEQITRYIAVVDINNGLNISGNTILTTGATLNSSLNVFGNTLLLNNVSVSSSLTTSGNTIIDNSVSLQSQLNIYGNTLFNGSTNLHNSLYVNGNMNLNGSSTITSQLNIFGNTSIYGSITLFSDLNISGNTLLQGLTNLNKSLYVSSNSLLQGFTTILGSLNISSNTNIYGASTLNNNLLVTENTFINGASTLLSNLNVSGFIQLSGNITIGSIINGPSTLQIFSNIISQLPNYPDNASAVLGGIPLWGFYRTGGILKIRLNDTPPQISLVGSNTITISNNTSYIDPGVIATSIIDGQITPFLKEIIDNNNINYLNNFVSINGTTNINIILPIGQYLLNYTATDNAGNIATITRNLIITL